MSADRLRRNIFQLQPLEIRRLLTTAGIETGGILHVVGGNGNDTITVGGSGSNITVTGVAGTFNNSNFTKIQIEGGDGNDTISIGSSVAYSGGSTINGNSGADSVTGAGQRDSLRGGIGHDTLLGGNNNDTLQGEDGNDFMDGGGGQDTIDGGNGLDTANYSYRTGNVDADNDGVADDGEGGLGEADNIFTNVEEIIGGAGRDTLTGGGNADFLGGGGNNDVLTGNGGNDALTASTGEDELHAGSGDDILQAQNNDRDTVDGGTGNFDSAQVDALDVGARDVMLDGVLGTGPSDLDGFYGDGDGIAIGPDLNWYEVRASAVDAQGRIVFVGHADNPSTGSTDMVAARYNADGSFDSGFGYGGETFIEFGSGYNSDYAEGVTVAADGSIFIIGTTYFSENPGNAAVAKLDDDGDLVSGFGSGGRVVVPSLIGLGYGSSGEDVAVQDNGKVAGAGTSNNGELFAFRLLADGSLDESFNGNGTSTVPIDAFAFASAIALRTVSGEQRIVIGGTADDDFAIARFELDGDLDPTFGGGDGIITQGFSSSSELNDLAIAPNGTIVAAGDTSNDTPILLDAPDPQPDETQAVIATFDASGALLVATGESSANESDMSYEAVTIDGSGRAVASGVHEGDFVVARYLLSDLTPDSTFAESNYVAIDVDSFDVANSVRVLANSKIVVGGYALPSESSPLLAGLRLNGGPVNPIVPNEGEVIDVESFFTYEDLHNNPGFLDNLSESAQNYMLWQPDGNGVARIDLTENSNVNNNVIINFVKTHGQDGYVSVNVDGLVCYYEPEDMTRIEIFAGDGNDTIIVDKKMEIPLLIDGGEGQDNIEGGDEDDILLGGPGNDNVSGGQGRNILIGGTGADNLKGGQKEDLIIAGATTHDDDVDSLLAIANEWNSANPFATRINFLRTGGGLNGAAILQANVTVFDDGANDIVDGQGNKDWLFVRLSGLNADQLKGAQGGAVIELI